MRLIIYLASAMCYKHFHIRFLIMKQVLASFCMIWVRKLRLGGGGDGLLTCSKSQN